MNVIKRERSTGNQPPRDYAAAIAAIEATAEERAPGVLDVIDVYSRVLPKAAGWSPINATAVKLATGTAQRDLQ